MKTDLFDFYIPEKLIAQNPSINRSDSRMLVYYRDSNKIVDSYTKNISDFIDSSYFLVFNNSKVIPARLKIKKKSTNHQSTTHRGEILVLQIIDSHNIKVLTDKSKKYKPTTTIILPDNNECEVKEDIDSITKILYCDKALFTIQYFDKYGMVPLPPYIKKIPSNQDKERYQTVYSKIYGSSAAPTAGLHFDDTIFSSLKKINIDYGFISLHVGLGTFQPIYSKNIEDHNIHSEEYLIDEKNASLINKAIENGKKILPIGTTSLRTLESAYQDDKIIQGINTTSLYIYPSYRFKLCDYLFTNFHTPKSSLFVLVSSLVGIEKLLEIYNYAIKKEYRFFSYGDAMLIL